MKTLNIILVIIVFLLCGCTSESRDKEDKLHVKAVNLELYTSSSATVTRADSYSVHTSSNPTRTLDGRQSWNLFVQIYDGNGEYALGKSDFTWDSGNRWKPVSGSAINSPNYSTQKLSATLKPLNYNGVATDQSSLPLFFEQDALQQNGESTINIAPAHIPQITLAHANSMLDFVVNNADEDDIADIWVSIGTDQYKPYRLPVTQIEYMLIFPTGTDEIEVHLDTYGGARYKQTINISGKSLYNNCYCVTFEGLELILSASVVVDWSFGQGIDGDYSTITSYPTFIGPVNDWVILYFDNGNEQRVNFNDQGEDTVKPVGRTIIAIERSDGYKFDLIPPLVLDSMVINLNSRIENGQ